MPDDTVGQENWNDCRSGEISTMVGRIKMRRRTLFATQLAGGAVLGLLLGFGFLQVRSAWKDARPLIAGISCRDVQQNADAFLKRTLPKDEHDRVAAHLGKCPECAKFVRSMNGKNPNGTRRAASIGTTLSQLPIAWRLFATQ